MKRSAKIWKIDIPSLALAGALALGALVAPVALRASPARAAAADTAVPVPTTLMIPRVYTRADGLSTMDEIELPRVSGGDGRSISTRLYATDVEMGISSPGTFIDWHGVTTPRLLMVIAGELEIGLGDGTRHVLRAGNIVYVTDMTGRGHTSRSIGSVPVQAVTLRLDHDAPLKPKLNPCPANVIAANCVANGLTITRPKP